VVTELRELLGANLTAYLGSVKETRAVNQWGAGERTPSAGVERRLRLALQLALMIAEADSTRVARSWFQGMNPVLDDDAPARLLREGDLDVVGPELVGAARAFLAA
jgi:hypothetical protein